MNQEQRPDLQIETLSRLLAAQGAVFRGMQEGPRGPLILFTDPATRTTLALAKSDFCPESLARRLQESRQAFGLSELPDSRIMERQS